MESILLVLAILAAFVLILDKNKIVSKALYRSVDWMLGYAARLKTSTAGQRGMIGIDGAIDAIITIILVMILIFQFIPTVENSADTSNITNTTVKTFGTLTGWLIPLLMVVGVITLGIRLFLKKGKRG